MKPGIYARRSALFFVTACFLSGCGHRDADEEERKAKAQPDASLTRTLAVSSEAVSNIGLQVQTAELSAIGESLSLAGTLDVDRDKPLIAIRAPQTGVAGELRLNPGDPIQRGQSVAFVGQSSVTSPCSGAVAEVRARTGDKVSQGNVLLTVLDSTELVAYLDAYEDQLSKIRRGLYVSILSPAFPHRVFPGKIATISPQLDPQTRAAVVRVALNNAEGTLKPGMAVSGTVLIPGPEKGLVAPSSAVVFDTQGGAWMYTRTSHDAYLRVPVEVAFLGNGRLLVKRGLRVGDVFVTLGAQELFSREFAGQIGAGD